VPSKPGDVLCEKKTKDYIILCWYPPSNDGGKPITAYVADIREIGSEIWIQYVSPLNTSTLDANLSFFFFSSAYGLLVSTRIAHWKTVWASDILYKFEPRAHQAVCVLRTAKCYLVMLLFLAPQRPAAASNYYSRDCHRLPNLLLSTKFHQNCFTRLVSRRPYLLQVQRAVARQRLPLPWQLHHDGHVEDVMGCDHPSYVQIHWQASYGISNIFH